MYVEPIASVEVFVANEYVARCDRPNFIFKETGAYPMTLSPSDHFYVDWNDNGILDSTEVSGAGTANRSGKRPDGEVENHFAWPSGTLAGARVTNPESPRAFRAYRQMGDNNDQQWYATGISGEIVQLFS